MIDTLLKYADNALWKQRVVTSRLSRDLVRLSGGDGKCADCLQIQGSSKKLPNNSKGMIAWVLQAVTTTFILRLII